MGYNVNDLYIGLNGNGMGCKCWFVGARTSKIQKWFDSMSVGEEIAPEEGGT